MANSPAQLLTWLGANVRIMRETRGCSQEQLAEKAGLHVSCIQRLERGKSDACATTLATLAKVFGIDAGPFFRPQEAPVRRPGNPKQRKAGGRAKRAQAAKP